MGDILRVRRDIFFEKSIETSHLEELDKALGQGEGVLFVTGHYGGIEYIPIFLMQAFGRNQISVRVSVFRCQLKKRKI